MTPSARPPARRLATSPFQRETPAPPTTDGFAVGDRVTLDSWGMGRVVAVTPEHVVVDFGAAGVRRIPAGTKGFSLL
ncbi:MAG TPA: hypothetical protein VE781_03970 [Kineosporiaceae bacterium]|nr:hypothetical protein [Kineosporiaceae bacterium]